MNPTNMSQITPPVKYGFWPTMKEEMLLKAALLEGEQAIRAWQKWRANLDTDRLDTASLQILPLLYNNLRNHHIEDPAMKIFKGFYRAFWYKNRLLFHSMADTLQSFHESGIRTMLLKGAALTLHYYKDYGLRSMGDFDVLVPTQQASKAASVLQKLDYKPIKSSIHEFNRMDYNTIHAYHFINGNGDTVDLHWHVLHKCLREQSDDDFWNSAIPIKIGNIATHVLNPSDQLLHICMHSFTSKNFTLNRLRWLADVMIILKTRQSEIDWNRMLVQVQKRRMILHLNEVMIYMRDLLNAPIPPEVMLNIQNMTATRIEKMEFQFHTIARSTLVGDFPGHWFTYIRLIHSNNNPNILLILLGFPKFLQRRWGLKNFWHLPFVFIFKGTRKILIALGVIH